MPKILNSGTAYVDQPCQRCGSKRRVSKNWIEIHPTLTGTTTVEYSQIVCTNNVCQTEFDKKLLVEEKKRKDMRLKKEVNDATRRANILRQARRARKNKSRI